MNTEHVLNQLANSLGTKNLQLEIENASLRVRVNELEQELESATETKEEK